MPYAPLTPPCPLLRCAALAIALAGCASGMPARQRDGGAELDAQAALDAQGAPDATEMIDAQVPPGTDAIVPPDLDAFVPPGTDGGPPLGTARYLDRCTGARDCASGLCAPDTGGTFFCTRDCTSDLQCAHEHVCAGGVCLADDTGEPCSVGTPETCATGLCLGSAAGGRCSRPCARASECPAGYACTRAGGSSFDICVDIERPCASAAECGTGLCLAERGCTAACDSAADCPARLPGFPPYTCELVSGTRVCAPPPDVVGDDAAGARCVFDGSGLNECRSGACDDTRSPALCVQTCSALGGCGPGLGCYPLDDGTSALFLCEPAGTGDLGSACGGASECRSGLCNPPGYCTRLCEDGLCPSDMHCMTYAGIGVSLCER